MSCRNNDDYIPACSMEPRREVSINLAGKVVGIDLEKPIDLSQMKVKEATEHLQMGYQEKMYFERNSILQCEVINEFGEKEKLQISITLISNRGANITEEDLK